MMGTFGGHALPGAFFIVFAVWWTVQIYMRFHRSRQTGGLPFHSTLTFKCSCLCGLLRNRELEGLTIIGFAVVGFTLEIITAFKDGHFTYLGNGQHATMFFFFGLSGLISILVHCKAPIPRGLDYATMTLAFCIEGLLFYFHKHGRDDMEILLHSLLSYAILGCVLSTLAEVKLQHSVLASLSRSFFVLLQGTWFWQIGFILYNPLDGATPWDHSSHDQMTVITMMFAWHVAAIFVFILGTGAVVGCVLSKREQRRPAYDSLSMTTPMTPMVNSNGGTVLTLEDDSDSDIEFQRPI